MFDKGLTRVIKYSVGFNEKNIRWEKKYKYIYLDRDKIISMIDKYMNTEIEKRLR